MDTPKWYGVRTHYEHTDRRRERERVYEERVVLVRAGSAEAAIALAGTEAAEYSGDGTVSLGFAMAFEMDDSPATEMGMGAGTEVFSLLRESRMDPKRYLDRFSDTGRERA